MKEIKNRIDALAAYCDEDMVELLHSVYNGLIELKDKASDGKSKDILAYEKKKNSINSLLTNLENDNGLSYFKTITDVYKYLTGAGYAVAERTIYEHKKQGKLEASADGYLKRDVDSYASKYLKRVQESEERLSYAEKKAKAEAEYKEIKTEKEKLYIDEALGRLIDRDAVAREFAGRIELVKRYLDELVSSVPALLIGKTEKEIRDVLRIKVDYVMEQYAAELELLK